MKFVYFGYDFMLASVRRLLEDGHELAGVFSFPCDNIFNFNIETVNLAQQLGIPFSLEKPKPRDIEFMREQGAEVFLAAGYLYRIPSPAPSYGLNIHPSLLPKGRSLMPIPHIILDHPEASGFTIHKLEDELDCGDILYQEALPLSPIETVETLSSRIALHAPAALSKVMGDLPGCWNRARPQKESEATHFPPPDDKMRTLDWNLSLERLDKIARAFGHFGSLAPLGGTYYAVYSHDIRREKHDEKPGVTILQDNGEITVAAKDGFFILKKFEKLAAS